MDSLYADIRHALRLFRRQPWFTVTILVALALGIGANSAIFSIVNTVLLKPLPYKDQNNIYYLWAANPEKKVPQSGWNASDYLEVAKNSSSFEDLSATFLYSATLTGQGEPARVTVLFVTSNYFRLTGIGPLSGAVFGEGHTTKARANDAVLSNACWRNRFGADPSVIGKGVTIDGELVTIIGVLPRLDGEARGVDVYLPFVFNEVHHQARQSRFLTVFGRLRQGVSPAQAVADTDAIIKRIAAVYPDSEGWRSFLKPVIEEIVGDSAQPLRALSAAVGVVLLIACVNVATLLLVRSSGRFREVAIRTAVGASQGRVLRQLLTESVVLSLLGGLLGLAAAWGLVWGIRAFGPTNIPRLQQAQIDGPVLIFTLVVASLSGVLFGLAPAIQALRLDLARALREEGRSGSGSIRATRLRDLMVASEVALSAILLASAGLLVRTLVEIGRIQPGFSAQNVLTLRTTLPDAHYPKPQDRAGYVARVLDKLNTLPGVAAASLSTAVPMMQVNWRADFVVDGRPAERKEQASYNVVTPRYFEALGIPLLRGRYFRASDGETSPPVVIISETFARQQFGDVDPIGKYLNLTVQRVNSRPEIVGVVGDVRQLRLDEPPRPTIYQPYAQMSWPFLVFSVRTQQDSRGLVRPIRSVFAEVDPRLPVDRVTTMDALVDAVLAQRRLAMTLLLSFAGLALLLSLIGLYAVLAYSVSQRVREFGIRMAIGADQTDVLLLVFGHGMLLTLAGLVSGLAVAPLAALALRGMLYNVGLFDPMTAVLVSVLLLCAAGLACWIPALRATRVDPAAALRAE